MESRLDVTKGQWHRGVEWIPEENITSPARFLRTNSRASSNTPGPIGEVGHDQPRLPAFHILKQLLLAAGVLKELPRPPS